LARTACLNSGQRVTDHFVEINEMVGIGKGGQRAVNARLLILSFDNFVNSVKNLR
jgi:DNA-damage-inducible protein D